MHTNDFPITLHRRAFLRRALLGSAARLTAPGAFDDQLSTARQMEGPFFPDKLPLDTGNDFIHWCNTG